MLPIKLIHQALAGQSAKLHRVQQEIADCIFWLLPQSIQLVDLVTNEVRPHLVLHQNMTLFFVRFDLILHVLTISVLVLAEPGSVGFHVIWQLLLRPNHRLKRFIVVQSEAALRQALRFVEVGKEQVASLTQYRCLHISCC